MCQRWVFTYFFHHVFFIDCDHAFIVSMSSLLLSPIPPSHSILVLTPTVPTSSLLLPPCPPIYCLHIIPLSMSSHSLLQFPPSYWLHTLPLTASMSLCHVKCLPFYCFKCSSLVSSMPLLAFASLSPFLVPPNPPPQYFHVPTLTSMPLLLTASMSSLTAFMAYLLLLSCSLSRFLMSSFTMPLCPRSHCLYVLFPLLHHLPFYWLTVILFTTLYVLLQTSSNFLPLSASLSSFPLVRSPPFHSVCVPFIDSMSSFLLDLCTPSYCLNVLLFHYKVFIWWRKITPRQHYPQSIFIATS